MYLYRVEPLDYWDLLIPIESLITENPEYGSSVDLNHLLIQAMEIAYKLSKKPEYLWDGDVECIYLFGLPTRPNEASNKFVHGFAWKQLNNGTTFICSPYELPWMNDAYLGDI